MVTRFLAVAIAVLLLGTPAFAADSGNLQIFRSVQKQVLQYPFFTIFDSVNAQIDNGVLTLTGKVTQPYKRTDIERRVRTVAGVTSVNNKIEVLPVSRFDDALRVQIARAIYSSPTFFGFGSRVNPPIHVIVDRGHVSLEGVVMSEVDRAVANAIARQSSAFSVKNGLKLEREVEADLEKL